MPTVSWRSFAKVDPEKEYIVQITYLPLKSFWKVIKFLRLTLAIQRQLESSPGLIGYSLQTKIIAHRFWTLSAWESQKDISNFVVKMPHMKVMQDLKNDMVQTKFVRWPVMGSSLPANWAEAMKHL
jgi:heme-degrading monooxygenase HmoA